MSNFGRNRQWNFLAPIHLSGPTSLEIIKKKIKVCLILETLYFFTILAFIEHCLFFKYAIIHVTGKFFYHFINIFGSKCTDIKDFIIFIFFGEMLIFAWYIQEICLLLVLSKYIFFYGGIFTFFPLHCFITMFHFLFHFLITINFESSIYFFYFFSLFSCLLGQKVLWKIWPFHYHCLFQKPICF